MKLTNKITLALISVGLVSSAAHGAEISDADLTALKQQIADLDQKVRVLEREREIDGETAATQAQSTAKLTVGQNGVNFISGDTNFVIQLHGLAQFDSRSFFNDAHINGNDAFLLRRLRPILTGTVFHDFDFNFTPDFGGSTVQVLDAYINYRYEPWFQIQGGKYKSPIGLEQLQSDPVTSFNERSIANNLVPNRDIGIDLHGDIYDGVASYALGIFDGSTDYNGTTATTSFQDDKAVEGRLIFQPFKETKIDALRGLGFGVAGSYIFSNPATNTSTGLTPGYLTDGQQKFFSYNTGVNASGAGWRISPQAYYYYGPFGLLAEYVISDQNAKRTAAGATPTYDVQNSAWEISGGWVLTGEDASYNGITPRHPFNLHGGGWGAWQLVARYGELDIDDNVFVGATNVRLADPTKNADEAQAWSIGLNWYLNKNIRANLSYSRTTFSSYANTKFAAGNVVSQPENVLFSRLQLSF
ncbi:MAG TPA: porin [Candidatus Sulfotelmatobacter sp.]|nr:porin [Candidatus Sulfotelmatobacter sp.]